MKTTLTRLMASAAILTITSMAASADVELTFRFNDSEREEMRAALDEFEAANPGITVELQTIAWGDSRDQFLREAAVGQGPDVVHIAFVWTQEMAEAGILRSIEELEGYQPLPNGFDDFIATELTEYEGQHWGLPWSADTWAMVYRTDVLAEAGISDLPTTWDELLADSRTIVENTDSVGFSFPAGNQIWFPVNYFLWSNGQEFISADGNGGYELGASADQVATAMEYFSTYIEEGLVSESILSIDVPHDPALMQALLDGDQAMALMPTNTFRQLLAAYEETHPGEDIPLQSGVMMAGSQAPQTHLGGRTLVVNANSDHPEEAWRLVQYLAAAPLFENYYVNQFPAQRSLLSQIDYRPEESGFSTQLAEHTRTWGAYASSGAGVGQMWNVTARAFGTALSGQSSASDTAADLLEELERMIAN